METNYIIMGDAGATMEREERDGIARADDTIPNSTAGHWNKPFLGH
jgi:hypothetical protein